MAGANATYLEGPTRTRHPLKHTAITNYDKVFSMFDWDEGNTGKNLVKLKKHVRINEL